ncbi:MAG TPA: hypothetical protein VK928_03010 [Longimicrobiales bacterium]|nr:hypothetical protein [Longimicrobiales bacterium]
MDDNSSEQRGLVPPPAVTRTAPVADMAGLPLMPPFVPGRATPAAHAAPEPEAEPAPLDLVEAEVFGPDPVERVDAEVAIPVPAPDEADPWPSLEEQGSAEPVWDSEDEASAAPNFPLDAFIVPEDSERVPSGYQKDHVAQADRIAARLDMLSRHVRAGGIAQLESFTTDDELTALIADVIAGYLHRGGHA